MRRTRLVALTIAIATTSALLSAQGQPRPAATGYQLPPQVIVDMLDAAPPPGLELSPTREVVALLHRASMPTIAELSQPMLRIAGRRINPRT
ncbi:MAG: S9 family peptidase, partial [Vicinamibacterales bacterium]